MKFLFPIVIAAAAIGLFVVYTNPQYQTVKTLQAQAAQYDDALNKAQELRKTRDQLLAKRNTFAADDVSRLEHSLPDNVDNSRLIIDINHIAAGRGLSLSSISVSGVSDSATTPGALAVGSSGSAVGSVTLDFTVTASYADFLAFLNDLEHSLRILDVESISFQAGKADSNIYSVSIRTYWLH